MKIGESTNVTMAKLVREESSKSMGSLLTSISTPEQLFFFFHNISPKNYGIPPKSPRGVIFRPQPQNCRKQLLLLFFYISILQEIWDISYNFICVYGVSPGKL